MITDVAMVNEALCKIICHNICCLTQEAHELGITTEFWANQSTPRSAISMRRICSIIKQ
jgi:hypothetical protein